MKVNGDTYLSQRGYAILKEGNEEVVEKLKEMLTVTPRTFTTMNPNATPPSFPVYRENNKKLYLPKNFGLQKFGLASHCTISDGETVTGLEFQGTMRKEQEEPIQAYLEAVEDKTRMGGIISVSCGQGKCVAKDTSILMYDGTCKVVQDIRVGDLLMGDDSTPRRVLSTCTGEEEMFDIIPTKGEKYTVNRSHILSLRCATNQTKKLRKGTIVDISVNDFLKLPAFYHGRGGPLYGYRTGVDFPTRGVLMDPYLVGYWLGDGHSAAAIITIQESTVVKYVANLLPKYNMYLQFTENYHYRMDQCTGKKNPFLDFLREFKLFNNKHIPHLYKCNSREIRLEVLAGIIDSDGYYHHGGFDITLKSEKLFDDILYLARSLGFAAYKKKCKKTCTNAPNGPKTGDYFRMVISGEGIDDIPTKVPRKMAPPRLQIKDVLMTRIKPVSIGMGTYYGFEIDGNHRFLLGDFTVTHNTVTALNLASIYKKKTLVICHKEFLLNQWKERIEQFLPKASVGMIKQKTVDVEGKDIVLASLQSLAMKEYPEKIFQSFGFVVIDECHHVAAEVFSQCLPKITARRMLGLSATLKRKDGLTKVFEWYLGKAVFEKKREDNHLQVLVTRFYDPHPDYGREVKLWNGKLNFAKMINQVCDFPPRNEVIVKTLLAVLEKEPDRQVLILSERRNHLVLLEKLLLNNKVTSVGYYIGGMKQEELDTSAKKQVLLGTFQLAQEGMDVPTLNTLILASPVSSIEQAVGRIQRQKQEHRKYKPIVIDMLDEFSIFERQGMKRLAFYRKNKYEVVDKETEATEKAVEVKKYAFIEDPDEG